MKCPHCQYVDGLVYDYSGPKTIKGEKGDFYRLSNDVKMLREMSFSDPEEKAVYGCPECGKLFFEP